MRSHKPALGFIFITLMLDVLGFGLLIPVGPRLVQQLGGGGEAQAAHYVGILAATYAVMQFFFAPTLGALSDRFGRRPVLLFALFGSGLDYFCMAFAPTLSWLFITRALNGITGASMTVANAYVADVTPPEKRAAGFGIAGAAFGLGFILGPLIGGFLGDPVRSLPLLGHGDIRYPFYAAGGLTLLNWLYGFFILPESLAPEHRSHFSLARSSPISAFPILARYPFVAWMTGSLFFLNLAQFGLHMTWVLYTGHRYHWTPRDVGLSLFLVGLGAAVVQAGLAKRVIGRIGERRALMFGLALAVLAYIGYGAATQGWMIYAIIVVGSLAGIAGPAAQSLITRSVRPDEQGAVQGALTAFQCIAQIIGPLIGTTAFAYFISDKAPAYIPGASFYASAILAAIGCVVASIAIRHGPPDTAGPQAPAKELSAEPPSVELETL